VSAEVTPVSVVVPTRERPQLLQRCLAALERQSTAVEVVVVEDAAGRGPAWARNEGVRRARGEVVCFTDDDCEPEPGWAQALAAPILAGSARAAAGRIVVAAGATAADRAWETMIGYLQAQAGVAGTASPGFAATANLACSRALLEELPFDECFPTAAGEDRDWAERAARAGAMPRSVPEAVVVHRSGVGPGDFLRRQYRYGQGAARYRARGANRRRGSLGFYAGLIGAGFGAGPAPGLLVCAAQAATLAGVISKGSPVSAGAADG
jgi:glycosyltransferase involved in cell wall biosynthesis